MISSEQFTKNLKLDISDKVEKRPSGSFDATYLSWPHAQAMLREKHEGVAVEFEKNSDGSPVFTHGDYAFLQPYLTDGKTRTPSIIFPVMDYAFNPVANPDACVINKCAQRATVKCIAVYTGIGLNCYIGEDLPPRASQTDYKESSLQNGSQSSKKHGSDDDWQSYPIKFGKYKEMTLGEIAVENPEYITGYLLDESKFEFKSESFREACFKAKEHLNAPAVEVLNGDVEDEEDAPF